MALGKGDKPAGSSRLETSAYKAQEEISKVLYDPACNIFKPWQFDSHLSHPVTLKTTYEELKILWNEEARFREGFSAGNDTIAIPNLFVKISGVHKDLCEYEKDVEFFLSSSKKLFFSSGSLHGENSSEANYVGYSKNGILKPASGSSLMHFISKNGALDIAGLAASHFFENMTSQKQLQTTIAHKLGQLLESDLLLKSPSEDATLRTLHMLLILDKSLIGLLENFDYPFEVPKIAIYNGKGTPFTFEDCAAISFFYYCGFDILILTPSGHVDIEKHINGSYFDKHSLEERNASIDYAKLKGTCDTSGKKALSRMAAFFKK